MRLLLAGLLLSGGCAPRDRAVGSQIDVGIVKDLDKLHMRLEAALKKGDMAALNDMATPELQVDLKNDKVAAVLKGMFKPGEGLDGILHQWYVKSKEPGKTLVMEDDPRKAYKLTVDGFPEVAVTLLKIPQKNLTSALMVVEHKVGGTWKVHCLYRGIYAIKNKTFPYLLDDYREAHQKSNHFASMLLASTLKSNSMQEPFGEAAGFVYRGKAEAAQLEQEDETQFQALAGKERRIEGQPVTLRSLGVALDPTNEEVTVPTILYVSPMAGQPPGKVDPWVEKLHATLRGEESFAGNYTVIKVVYTGAVQPPEGATNVTTIITPVDWKTGKARR